MENKQKNIEQSQAKILNQFNQVTKLSKYLAMVLFIILPFVGFWFGYKYGPEKVVESEKVVIKEVEKIAHNEQVNASVYNGRGRAVGVGCFPYEFSPKFTPNVNLDPPNTIIKYNNKGISFDIPYNNNWGNEKCVIRPYFEDNNGLIFGEPNPWEGGDQFVLLFKSSKSSDEFIDELLSDDSWNPNPKKITINNKEVVTYDDAGMLLYKHYVMFGEEYNYDFYTADSSEDKLVEVLKTVVI